MDIDDFVSKKSDTLDSMIESMGAGGNQNIRETSGKEPAYMKKTWASTRPNCGNDETERVRNSFRTGSWWTLKKLPAKLACGNVEHTRKQNVIANRLGKREFRYKALVTTNYFNKNEYVYSDYDKFRMQEKNNTEKNQMKTASFSREPFTVTNRMKTLTEDTFSDKEYKVPYMGPGHDKVNMSQITRADTFDVSKYTAGPFNPAGKKQSDVTRTLIREWIQKIYAVLAEGWPALRFTTKWSHADEMEILFTFAGDGPESTLPPNNALPKFMNALATSGLAAELKFTRRGDKWNVPYPKEPEEGVAPGLLFTFYAPWVKRGYVTVRRAMSNMQRDQVREARRRKQDELHAAHVNMYGMSKRELADQLKPARAPSKSILVASRRGGTSDVLKRM